MENLLALLPLLACPIGMGLMMWLMMRGNHGQAMNSNETPAENLASNRSDPAASPDDRLAMLRARLDELQTEQATFAAQIGQVQSEDRTVKRRSTADDDLIESTPAPVQQSA